MEPQELLNLFLQRQSVRGYSSEPVSQESLSRCIEAARLAPSACNAQPWKFVIVKDPELKNKVADATSGGILPMNHFTKQAPVIVVMVREKANLSSRIGQTLKNKDFTLIDNGIAAIQFCLQATVEGLGTCIMGWFNEKKIKDLLHIPPYKRVELIIPIGHPADPIIRPKIRKNTDQISTVDSY